LGKSDSKAYWSFLNKCDTKGNKAVNEIAIDVLHDHLKNVNALDEDDDNDIVFPTNITEYNIELNQDITEAEVLYAVKSLKNNKACGGDLILNEFLKHATVKLMAVFVRIFNIVFHSGIVPDSWSEGYVCPIYKNKGNPNNVDNYRGITILSCYGKLFTCILNNRLHTYLENSSLMCEEQAGFRKGYSTTYHIYNLKCLIDLYLHRGRKLYCVFVDYCKAFDSVRRVYLWQKLLKCTIVGKLFKIIKSMYSNAKSCVRQGNSCSNFFQSNVGVRQ
jgi:hypothetical protein